MIIEPEILLTKLQKLHGNAKTIQSYLWVTNEKDNSNEKQCWETRGLKQVDQTKIANHTYQNEARDFTEYLNNWGNIVSRLK